MFELSVALKYLVPKRKQLSVSLIALLSVGVISLVVWLVLVFLSVTEGIERGWLEKLTSLNAPIRITPTPAYYSSYYYRIDEICEASHFTEKTIGEKAASLLSDPYDPENDSEVPLNIPAADRKADGTLRDPVKEAFAILEGLKREIPELTFQEYEISGALMRLQLLRPESGTITARGANSQNFLTQVSYLASLPNQNPQLKKLLSPPTLADLNHLFFLANQKNTDAREDSPIPARGLPGAGLRSSLQALIANSKIKALKSSLAYWRLPQALLPQRSSFTAVAYIRQGEISHLVLPGKGQLLPEDSVKTVIGTLQKDGDLLFFESREGKKEPIASHVPLIADRGMQLQAELIQESLETAEQLKDIRFAVKGELQGHVLSGEIHWESLEIADAEISTEEKTEVLPLWAYQTKNLTTLPVLPSGESAVLLAKNFQDSGVRVGDRGYLSYAATTASSVQEQRQPIYVAGFYDPGVMGIGNKWILAPSKVIRTINASNNSIHLDQKESNGIQVWLPNIEEAEAFKAELQKAFREAGISKYWKVATFREFDFAKDLLQQFQSDKYLFSLIGIIILMVACCNIISLLVLLVNDKKREIGILQSMGASAWSIASIFGLCGVIMGLLSSMLGMGAALLTLHNIDSVVQLLSWVQGHEAFNAAFYGKSLPGTLSHQALLFVLIATPIISLCAGLVPAIKACRLRPSAILRSE